MIAPAPGAYKVDLAGFFLLLFPKAVYSMADKRPVFYISDGTGITAETIGHSLLTQFTDIEFIAERISFVDSVERADDAVEIIKAAADLHGVRPVVINSCMASDVGEALAKSGALMLDVFAPFIEPLERELGQSRMHEVGRAHAILDFDTYHRRINAMNYALTHDDGVSIDYNEAEVILVAVSRAGKTPSCVYLALQYGVRAANYPLTEEDLATDRLPERLRAHREKLFGLTIDPQRLHQIRQERRPNSRYAKLENCRYEVAAAEALFRAERIPTLSTTNTSIEEIASKVMSTLRIRREMF